MKKYFTDGRLMNGFFAYFVARFKTVMVFKLAAISGFISQVFFALFRIYIILAFSLGNSASSPMQIQSTILYIWIAQIFFAIVPWNVNWEDFHVIKSGNVAYEIIRPIDLFSMFFSKTLSWRLANCIVRGLPVLLVNIIVLPLIGMKNISLFCMGWKNIGGFIISITLGFVLSSLITVFLYSIALLVLDASNFIGFFNSIAMLISGTIIPLSYFPSWLRTILMVTPFKGVIDTPAMIITGEYDTKQMIMAIIGQLIWCVALYVVNRLIIYYSTKRLVVQGG